jgi:hypothetical protein
MNCHNHHHQPLSLSTTTIINYHITLHDITLLFSSLPIGAFQWPITSSISLMLLTLVLTWSSGPNHRIGPDTKPV